VEVACSSEPVTVHKQDHKQRQETDREEFDGVFPESVFRHYGKTDVNWKQSADVPWETLH
jgi:hypothetical protein